MTKKPTKTTAADRIMAGLEEVLAWSEGKIELDIIEVDPTGVEPPKRTRRRRTDQEFKG